MAALVPDLASDGTPRAIKPAHSADARSVLIVDDDPVLRRSLIRVFSRAGFRALAAESGEDALRMLTETRVEVVLLDVGLPGIDGLETLDRIKLARPLVEVVIMTGNADLAMSVDAMRRGAQNFISKPFRSNELVVVAIEKAIEHARLVAALRDSRRFRRMPPLVGESDAMQKVYALAQDVASTSVSVLILGETGTGKEVLAKAIHDGGPRAARAFVPANCSAIPQELVESELFGHEKGAFTGALRTRPGLFQRAHGGTLFLDEIGDLPLLGQAKLLRALQSGEVRAVGADESRQLDVRIIAATNADVKGKLERKEFREDLFYRLNVVTIHLPSLVQRREDIPLLAKHFARVHATRLGIDPKRLSDEALWRLMRYAWPGNVRQLENAIEAALVVTRGDVIRAEDLKLNNGLKAGPPSEIPFFSLNSVFERYFSLPFGEAKRVLVQEFEAEYALTMLGEADGNISEAARRSGLDRTNFRRLVQRAKKGRCMKEE
jgi:DNA-binding NtrC family response regulator